MNGTTWPWEAQIWRLGESRAEYEARAGQKRYAKKKIRPAVREAVYERDRWRCVWCGSDRDLSLDHIVAEWSGGGHAIDNLQTLCLSCNCSKGAT